MMKDFKTKYAQFLALKQEIEAAIAPYIAQTYNSYSDDMPPTFYADTIVFMRKYHSGGDSGGDEIFWISLDDMGTLSPEDWYKRDQQSKGVK